MSAVFLSGSGKNVLDLCDSVAQFRKLCSIPPLYSTILYSSGMFCSGLNWTVLDCSVLFCSGLFCTVLFCTILHWSVIFIIQIWEICMNISYNTQLNKLVKQTHTTESCSSRNTYGLLFSCYSCFYFKIICWRKTIQYFKLFQMCLKSDVRVIWVDCTTGCHYNLTCVSALLGFLWWNTRALFFIHNGKVLCAVWGEPKESRDPQLWQSPHQGTLKMQREAMNYIYCWCKMW